MIGCISNETYLNIITHLLLFRFFFNIYLMDVLFPGFLTQNYSQFRPKQILKVSAINFPFKFVIPFNVKKFSNFFGFTVNLTTDLIASQEFCVHGILGNTV